MHERPSDHQDGDQVHFHTHGVVDPSIVATSRGIWAIKWSFAALALTAAFQVVVVVLTGSVALLADTIHNVGDALTAVPLWIAFLFARRLPSRRFTYGFGRVEDFAGGIIVLVILASALTAGYASIDRLLNPRDVQFLWAVAVAGGIGFVGNEAVAIFRIRIGRQINSAALIADGHHARADGLTSLAVLGGAVAVGAGFPVADPIVGLAITLFIGKIVWDSAKTVFSRMLDGVEEEIIDEIEHLAGHVVGVIAVSQVRARWVGHRLEAEVQVTAGGDPTLTEAHDLAVAVGHALSHEMSFVANTIVHVDPLSRSGTGPHRIAAHEHDGLAIHGH